MSKKDKAAKLTGLFVLSLLLFNFPLLMIFSKGEQWNGIPLVLLYLLFVWIFIILAVFWLNRPQAK
jgi:hypothetical protein